MRPLRDSRVTQDAVAGSKRITEIQERIVDALCGTRELVNSRYEHVVLKQDKRNDFLSYY